MLNRPSRLSSLRSRHQLAVYAHAQRLAPTWSERLLWERLRGSRLGVGFRRQAETVECEIDAAQAVVAAALVAR
jgi:hypothetical protein